MNRSLAIAIAAVAALSLTACARIYFVRGETAGYFGVYTLRTSGGAASLVVTDSNVRGLGFGIDASQNLMFQSLGAGFRSGVLRRTLDGQNLSLICQSPETGAIAVDERHHYVFWMDTKEHFLHRCNTDGSDERVVVQDLQSIGPIAFDAEGEKICWLRQAPDPGVRCADVDGSNVQPVYVGSSLTDAIGIDSRARKVFGYAPAAAVQAIVSIDFGSSTAKALFAAADITVDSFVLDTKTQTIYSMEHDNLGTHSARVMRMDYDGKNRQVLHELPSGSLGSAIALKK